MTTFLTTKNVNIKQVIVYSPLFPLFPLFYITEESVPTSFSPLASVLATWKTQLGPQFMPTDEIHHASSNRWEETYYNHVPFNQSSQLSFSHLSSVNTMADSLNFGRVQNQQMNTAYIPILDEHGQK